MRHVRSSWAVFIITLSTLFGAPHQLCAQQADTVRTATLAGVVRDSTGAPITDVIVNVGRTRLGARTSAAGWFTIERVPPGDYTVRFERLGYGGATFAWHARAGERTEIAIELAPIARDLDTVVVRGKASSSSHPRGHAEVLGIVVDSAGVPLPDAQVQVIGSGRFASTGKDGQFLFPELAPGSYLLRIRRLGFVPQTIPVIIGEDGRHSIAIRMSALGLLLDTVEVRAKSGFGKDASVWRDFDARLQWGSSNMRSVIIMGEELRKLGKTPLDIALQHSAGAVRAGAVPGLSGQKFHGTPTQIPTPDGSVGVAGDPAVIKDDGAACILVNGKNAMYWPLRAFHADELQAVEVYAGESSHFTMESHQASDFTRSVVSRMSTIPAYAPSLLGSHPPYYVVWLKGAQ